MTTVTPSRALLYPGPWTGDHADETGRPVTLPTLRISAFGVKQPPETDNSKITKIGTRVQTHQW